jgi:hypothetical protein
VEAQLYSVCLGVYSIASVLQQTKLTKLNLNSIPMGDDGLIKLASNLKGSRLMHLNIGRCRITDHGLDSLVLVLRDSRLVSLELFNNEITSKSVIGLSKVVRDSTLKALSLQNNKEIGWLGGSALAEGIRGSGLQHLNLRNCQIPTGCAEQFVKNLRETQLRTLKLANNPITKDGLVTIIEALRPYAPGSSSSSLSTSSSSSSKTSSDEELAPLHLVQLDLRDNLVSSFHSEWASLKPFILV